MRNKLYPCKQCGKEVKIRSKGLCTYCRQLQKGSVVKRYQLKQQTAKNKEKKRQKSQIMQAFWQYHLSQIQKNPYCGNCGCRIQGNINNIAHLIPKRTSPEVMDDLNNAIYLCASINGGQEIGCHEKFDRVAGSSQVYLMPFWTQAIVKYLKFRDKIIKYSRYTEIFEQYLEENAV